MKIVDKRAQSFGLTKMGFEIYPYLNPDSEIRFNGYISVYQDEGKITVRDEVYPMKEMSILFVEMLTESWVKALEIAQMLEKDFAAVIESDYVAPKD